MTMSDTPKRANRTPYQPSKAEKEEEVDMPGWTLDQVRKAFMRPPDQHPCTNAHKPPLNRPIVPAAGAGGATSCRATCRGAPPQVFPVHRAVGGQPLPHQGAVDAVVVDPALVAGVVGWINIDALDLASIAGQQGLQPCRLSPCTIRLSSASAGCNDLPVSGTRDRWGTVRWWGRRPAACP